MAIEVVLLVPVLVAVMLLVIGFGRFVDRQGDVDAAAREAARAASYQRDFGAAQSVAQQAANQALPSGISCSPVSLGRSSFTPGGFVVAELSCQVSFAELVFAGLPGSASLSGESVAPLDQWRRTG